MQEIDSFVLEEKRGWLDFKIFRGWIWVIGMCRTVPEQGAGDALAQEVADACEKLTENV